jgi:antitoxin component YwqK of YwqJK toxin-antitoxin module
MGKNQNRQRKNNPMLRQRKSLLFLFFLIPLIGMTQIFKTKINQVDAGGHRQGRWIQWQDSVRRVPFCTSWYKDGIECRATRYYNSNGTVRLKFRYLDDSLIRVKYFDEKGRLTSKGTALLLYTDTEIRYCWDGVWKEYDKWRRVKNSSVYRKGEELSGD